MVVIIVILLFIMFIVIIRSVFEVIFGDGASEDGEKNEIKKEKYIKEDNFFIQLKNESLKNLTPPISLTYPTLTDAFKDFAIKMSANKETKEQFDSYVTNRIFTFNGWTVRDYPYDYFPSFAMPNDNQLRPLKVEGFNLSMAFRDFERQVPVSNEDAICYCTALELYSEKVIKTNKTLDKYGNIIPYSKEEE